MSPTMPSHKMFCVYMSKGINKVYLIKEKNGKSKELHSRGSLAEKCEISMKDINLKPTECLVGKTSVNIL